MNWVRWIIQVFIINAFSLTALAQMPMLISESEGALSNVSLQAEDEEEHPKYVSPYYYPIFNPLISTITTVAISPSKKPLYKAISFELYPERSQIPNYGRYNRIKLAFFKNYKNANAPMIFLIPGIGGYALYPNTIYLAEVLYRAGFHVVTLPATLSWQFALSVSQSGYPGYSPRDAADMLSFMIKVDQHLRKEENINPSRYGLMGYSLGALDSGFVANLDLDKKYFNFDRVLMVNPPLQKAASVRSLDGLLLDDQRDSTQARAFDIMENSKRFFEFGRHSLESLIKFDFNRPIGLVDAQMSRIIGASFRQALGDVIVVSQEIYDLGILPTSRDGRYAQGIRKAEALMFSFRDYLDKVLLREITHRRTLGIDFDDANELLETTDLRKVISNFNEQHRRWAIFHNQNDFIFHDGDLQYLMKSKSASRVYPLGGHLGNLWYKRNQRDILRYFEPMKTSPH
jgi:hypothetical protein